MLAALSLGLSLAAPVFAASGPLRTAVIAVGSDDAQLAVGALQRELEVSVGRVPGVEIVPATLIAPALAGVAAMSPASPLSFPSADPGARQAWEDLFLRVERSFVEDRLQEALQSLAEIDRLHQRTRFVPTAERVRLLLWRATVHLAEGDSTTAEQRVRAALVLDPTAPVDPRVFPPSVRRLAAAVTDSRFRPVKLRVTGAPAGSAVFVDGRPVPEEVHGEGVEIPTGSHILTVGAAGFRWVEVPLPDVQSDRVIDVALPLAPPASTEQMLRDMAVAGPETVPDFRALQDLAASIGADALVIVTHRQQKIDPDPAQPCEEVTDPTGRKIRGVFWRRGRTWSRTIVAAPRAYADDEAGRRAFATWLDGELADASAGFLSAIGTTVSASVGPSLRLVNFYDKDHDGYKTAFMGVGGAVAVGIAPGRWLASVEGTYAHFGFIGVKIRSPGEVDNERRGPENDASGGYVYGGNASIGRRFLLKGDSFESGVWWSIEGVAGWERREADDVNALGIFPSHDRSFSGPRVRGALPVPWTPIVVEAAVTGHVYSNWEEEPEGTSGTKPTADPRGSFELLARWQRPRSPLRWAGVFQIESRSTSFTGLARMPVQPAITGARRDEDIYSLLLRVEWQP